MSNPSSPLPRIGLIGVSGYAQIYVQLLRDWHARGLVSVAAVVVINPDQEPDVMRELAAWGSRIYSSYEAMIAAERGRLDLCLIPTGIQWHARMTIAALEAGMNVLVEKPLAGSLADAQAIRAAEKASGRFVAVGFQDIYAPEVAWLKAQLCSGSIGRIKSVRLIGQWPRARSYFERNHWAGRLHADGAAVFDSPLNNAFAHFVNMSIYFAGPALGVSADATVTAAELYRAQAIETFDTATVQAKSADGIEFWFGVTHSCLKVREPEIYIEGTAGRAEWKHEQRCVLAPDGVEPLVRGIPDTTGTRRAMFAAVVDKLIAPATPVCDTAVAERHTAFIEGVHRASPVRVIAESQFAWVSPAAGSSPVPAVHGIEETLDLALRKGCLLSEAGFSAEPAASRL